MGYARAASVQLDALPKIKQTLRTLARIRAYYFLGFARGVYSTALYEEKTAKDLEKAETLLKSYTERCRNDPEGHINLAHFYSRHERFSDAIGSYEEAIQSLVDSTPKKSII